MGRYQEPTWEGWDGTRLGGLGTRRGEAGGDHRCMGMLFSAHLQTFRRVMSVPTLENKVSPWAAGTCTVMTLTASG